MEAAAMIVRRQRQRSLDYYRPIILAAALSVGIIGAAFLAVWYFQ
jgi:hypothetical protein